MEPLFIDEEQRQKTNRGWVRATHWKIACLLTMAVFLVLLLIFVTLYVSEQRLCGAQKEKLDSINEATEALSKRLDWQDKQIGEDLVNLNVTNTSQRTTVLEMQEKMDSMYQAFEALSKRLDSLDVNMGRKLDLVNAYVKNASQRTTALEMQDNQDSMFKAIEALSKRFDSLGTNMERKLDLVNVNVMNMSERTTALEMKVRKIFPLLKNPKSLNENRRRISPNYSLLFPYKSKNDYVIITHRMPSLTAVTVCMWIKTNATGSNGALLSYAVSGSDNELFLIMPGHFGFGVRSVGSGYTRVSANDGKWHHICAAWENTAGSWKLIKDGYLGANGTGLAKGRLIRGGGHLVLGQDQDKLGGGFQEHQSFIGEMADVNIWNHVISDQEIRRMSKLCLTGTGNLFQWSDFKYHRMGSVQIVQPSCLN